MKFKLTKVVEAEECIQEFLEDKKHLANKVWSILKHQNGTYSIVYKITNEITKEFKEKELVYNGVWLITLMDNTQCLMYFDQANIKLSKAFLRIIKVFDNFILIENLDGKRKILNPRDFSKEHTWFYNTTDNYKILRLPNGNKTILKKQGLELLDFEFDDYIFSAHITNIVIASVEELKCLVRISDFNTSLLHPDITVYSVSKEPVKIIEYVIITSSENQKFLMRVEDFETSDIFDDIKPINKEYAIVTINGKDKILRLSDFRLAIFK